MNIKSTLKNLRKKEGSAKVCEYSLKLDDLRENAPKAWKKLIKSTCYEGVPKHDFLVLLNNLSSDSKNKKFARDMKKLKADVIRSLTRKEKVREDIIDVMKPSRHQ